MKIVAIGGVAASMSAVSKLRRLDKDVTIDVYEQGDVLSYGACGMPYYVSDEIKHKEELVARTKADFTKKDITVHTFHKVIDVDDTAKELTIKNLKTNETFKDTYDKLIIGSGASPVMPKWNGINLENIHTMTQFEDSVAVKKKLDTGKYKNVTIIGGGFIGMEMAESFHTRGLNVRIIEFFDQVLNVFDKDIIEPLHEYLTTENITLNLSEEVQSFTGDKKVETVVTNKGEYKTDLVLLAIGIRPNSSFLKNSNVKTDKRGTILVDRTMQTSVKDIYAGGDCATIYNRQLQAQKYYPMGNNANKQGKLIARNIIGENVKIDGVLGTIVIKVLDKQLGKTGITEKQAKELDLPHKTVKITGRNHAGYYPNAKKITAKIIYEPETFKILGAELYGEDDTALRIDIFVVAISKEMTTKELGMLDLAYAPPFSGVWDVVAVAANQAK
ncbi:MAG: CoA-disulfide reductase [Candidatus Izimaplasma sp.]|nr:CoA-disulfide reductase [Candidatus Izimaplasma bacterium]